MVTTGLQTQVTSTVQMIAPSKQTQPYGSLLPENNTPVSQTGRTCPVNKPSLPRVADVCLARSMPVDKTENPKDNPLIMVKHIVYTSFFSNLRGGMIKIVQKEVFCDTCGRSQSFLHLVVVMCALNYDEQFPALPPLEDGRTLAEYIQEKSTLHLPLQPEALYPSPQPTVPFRVGY